jgi:hypothetical protein
MHEGATAFNANDDKLGNVHGLEGDTLNVEGVLLADRLPRSS